jgi:hypothetical protein
LRNLNTNELIAVNVDVCTSGFYGTFVFAPVVDGTFIKERPSEMLKQGKLNTVSLAARHEPDSDVFYVGYFAHDDEHIRRSRVCGLFVAIDRTRIHLKPLTPPPRKARGGRREALPWAWHDR